MAPTEQPPYLVSRPAIEWQAERPFESRHGDWYASHEPVAEKHHVFLNGCELPERFAQLRAHRFVIGEIGFGFGTNFLLALAAWQHQAHGRAHLHYVAFDSAPPAASDLKRWHKATGLAAADLLHAWPEPVRGVHRLHFRGNVHLTLVLDDMAAVQDLIPAADAWFLDGFSPARNPDAWDSRLLALISQRLRPGGILATYSAAHAVRHALESAGLAITRTEGFGRKRHMTRARATGDWVPTVHGSPRVAVLGGGLAGSSITASLERHGADPILVDSGAPIPQRPLVIFPYLSAAPEPFSRFSLAAFEYVQRTHCHALTRTGLFRIAEGRNAERLAVIADRFAQAPGIVAAGKKKLRNTWHTGLEFERAGWTSETQLRRSPHLKTTCTLPTTADSNVVRILGERGDAVLDAEACVITAGAGVAELAELYPYIQSLPGSTAEVALSPDPHLIQMVSGAFTLVPLGSGRYSLGATWPTAPNPVLEQDLDARVMNALGCTVSRGASEQGLRCSTRDRVPLMGKLHAGVWLCTAFGARGATHAPLAAEACVSQLLGLPAATSTDITRALAPGRFALRAQRKGRSNQT